MDIPIPSWVLEDSRRDVYKIYFYYDMTLVPVSAITSWASSDSLRNSLGTTEQFCKRPTRSMGNRKKEARSNQQWNGSEFIMSCPPVYGSSTICARRAILGDILYRDKNAPFRIFPCKTRGNTKNGNTARIFFLVSKFLTHLPLLKFN